MDPWIGTPTYLDAISRTLTHCSHQHKDLVFRNETTAQRRVRIHHTSCAGIIQSINQLSYLCTLERIKSHVEIPLQ